MRQPIGKVTQETVRAICDLVVAPEQREFVAPNAHSIAEAYFEPKAWFRAVYAGDMPGSRGTDRQSGGVEHGENVISLPL